MLEKIAKLLFAVLVCWLVLPSAAAAGSSEMDFRVEWLYRDSITGAHPSGVQWLENGRFLAVYNGYTNPRVKEISPAGEKTWSFEGIQAASARRLPGGSTLIADSGAPGYPMVPRVIEVDPSGRVTWEHRFNSRAQAPTSASLLDNGSILVTTRSRIFELTRDGETGFVLDAGSPLSSNDKPEPFLYITSARELPGGNILVVDRGIYGRKNGRVVEVTPRGEVVKNIGPLERPADAVRLENGHTRILELGSYKVLEYNREGRKVDEISYRQVITELGVSNQWSGSLLPSGHFLLSISHSWGGATAVLEINDNIPRLFIDDEEYKPREDLLMADGIMLAPARELFKKAGIELYYHEETGQVLASRGDISLLFTLDKPEFELRGRTYPLEAAPRLVDGKTYVPVSLLKDGFGLTLTRGPGEKSRRTINICREAC